MKQPVDITVSPFESGRRSANMLQPCTVAEVRTQHPARCRVRVGDLHTDWLPWLALRAVNTAYMWWAPRTDEQALLLCPGGDLRQGVVLPALYSDEHRPGTDAKPDNLVLHNDKSTLVINPDSIILRVGDSSLVIDEAGVHAHPDIDAKGISLVRHVHGGVMPGGSNTGGPK